MANASPAAVLNSTTYPSVFGPKILLWFLPMVVLARAFFADQGAINAASQSREDLPLWLLAFLPPLPWNDLVASLFRLGRVAWRYTPRIGQCVGRSRL